MFTHRLAPVLACLIAATAAAQPQYFTSPIAYENALSAPGIVLMRGDFEPFGVDDTGNLMSPYTTGNSGLSFAITSNPGVNPAQMAVVSQRLRITGGQNGAAVTITLPFPVHAFACFILGWQNNAIFNGSVIYTDNAGGSTEAATQNGGNQQFIGVFNPTARFSSVTLNHNLVSGESFSIDDITVSFLGDADLGTIAPTQFRTLFETNGSNFDTEIALWDEQGNLISFNDDAGLGLASSIFTALPGPGTYIAAIGGFNSGFNDNFSATPGTAAGLVTATVAGRRLAPFNLAANDLFYFKFNAAPDVSPSFNTPRPIIDFGVVAAPGQPVPIFVSTVPNQGGLFALFNADTGERIDVASLDILISPALPAGRYLIGATAATGAEAADGFAIDPSVFETALEIFIADQSASNIATAPGGNPWLAFEVAEADCAADFNNDGSIGDIFDLFDFLAALDAGCP